MVVVVLLAEARVAQSPNFKMYLPVRYWVDVVLMGAIVPPPVAGLGDITLNMAAAVAVAEPVVLMVLLVEVRCTEGVQEVVVPVVTK